MVHQEFTFKGKLFDGIIADVPCSGSGTWSRTPEMLTFFDEQELVKYTDRQKEIVTNVMPYLKPGGYLIYITCSVFKVENEDIVAHLSKLPQLELVKTALINGIANRSDSMFYALFKARNGRNG